MERKALGKGLGALIPDKQEGAEQEVVLHLKIQDVKPNPYQPREDFDPQSLEELKQSIKEKGIIQPILVRRKGDQYELIAGERRWRAATELNLTEIPALVKEVEDLDSLELSLIENIQRQELNPIEEARAFKYMIEKFSLTQERVSEVLGKGRATVANTLRLLKLPLEIQEDIRKNRLSFAHGKTLLEIEDSNQQRKLAHEAISKGLSVKELESLVKTSRPRIPKQNIRSSNREPLIAVLEDSLQQALATKVRISKRSKRGQISIEFYSQEDLERIVNKIKGQ